LARTHSVYATKFSPVEAAEVEETAALLRELVLIYSPAFEPALQLLGARLWRLKRGYEFLEEHGEEAVPPSLLTAMGALENTISRDFEALGLSPRAAAKLGIDLRRLARAGGADFDLNLLTREERAELSRLLAKGEGDA
jgi:hypothetical protein